MGSTHHRKTNNKRYAIVDDAFRRLLASGETSETAVETIAVMCEVTPTQARRWVQHLNPPGRVSTLTPLAELANDLANTGDPLWEIAVHAHPNGRAEKPLNRITIRRHGTKGEVITTNGNGHRPDPQPPLPLPTLVTTAATPAATMTVELAPPASDAPTNAPSLGKCLELAGTIAGLFAHYDAPTRRRIFESAEQLVAGLRGE